MPSDKLPPQPQSFYEDNRQRFDADMSAFDVSTLKNRCNHYFIRHTATEIRCKNCPAGWTDLGKFEIANGRVLSVR